MVDTASASRHDWKPEAAALIAFVALCLIAGWLGTIATTPNIPTWYAALKKPSFNPPNGVFPVVWTILYLLMAFAAWIVWRERHEGTLPAEAAARQSNSALLPFFVQLVLNVAWSFSFFGAHSPLLGLIVITLLAGTIVWTMAAFWYVAANAALLLIPYLAWVVFATALNAAILVLN